MEEERPFGWRPLTEQQKAEHRKLGLTEESIAEIERSNAYRPDETATLAYEFTRALVVVLGDKLGREIIEGVKAEMVRRTALLARSDEIEDRVEAAIISPFVESDWDRLGLTD